MTWERAKAADALAEAIREADVSGTVSVFSKPPETLNAPAIVIGAPTEVTYATASLGVDACTLPVVCLGPLGAYDAVDDLVALVRKAVLADGRVGGTVQSAVPTNERNWRAMRIGGADFTAADCVLTVQM